MVCMIADYTRGGNWYHNEFVTINERSREDAVNGVVDGLRRQGYEPQCVFVFPDAHGLDDIRDVSGTRLSSMRRIAYLINPSALLDNKKIG